MSCKVDIEALFAVSGAVMIIICSIHNDTFSSCNVNIEAMFDTSVPMGVYHLFNSQ